MGHRSLIVIVLSAIWIVVFIRIMVFCGVTCANDKKPDKGDQPKKIEQKDNNQDKKPKVKDNKENKCKDGQWFLNGACRTPE